jgi:hypothetical protein
MKKKINAVKNITNSTTGNLSEVKLLLIFANVITLNISFKK